MLVTFLVTMVKQVRQLAVDEPVPQASCVSRLANEPPARLATVPAPIAVDRRRGAGATKASVPQSSF
jgi:hypothetical protein